MEHLQYPIGRFLPKPDFSPEELSKLIDTMETSPARYKQLIEGISEADLSKTYREGSWTVRQLVHHVADIHLLNFLRIKKLLTEEENTTTIIDMNAWATTADSLQAPLTGSLLILEGISYRFTLLLKSLEPEVYNKRYYHPVRKIYLTLKQALYMAVWHLEHHMAHIEIALGRQPHSFSLE